MRSEEYSSCFNLLDGHARSGHGCFLAEFFQKSKGEGSYWCCFRPIDAGIDALNRSSCKYVKVSVDQVENILSSHVIPEELARILDEELAGLRT